MCEKLIHRLQLRLLLCAGWFWASLAVSEVLAQRLDSFEGGNPRWRLVESDCKAQVVAQEISPIIPHSGRTSELIEISCGNGQTVLLAYPVEPCSVLNEFEPSIWMRCAHVPLRLGVRVVFPKAIHPVQQGRLTTILWGDIYSQSGQWQRLQVKQLGDRLLHEQAAIRNQFETPLDLSSAYIDSLVINAYTGPGRIKFQLDDLDFGSMIPLASVGIPLPADWRERWCWRDDVSVQFSSNLQMPIWIENRGEQPAWLNSLGFNGVLMNQLPSTAQLNQIFQSGMHVICPPPEHLVEFDEKQLVAFKGWLIGTALNREQTELARQQAGRAERLPTALKRPLIGEALEHFWLYGRIANQIIVPGPDPISAGRVIDKHRWLRDSLETVKVRGDGWVSVNVHANPALFDQFQTVTEQIEGQADQPMPANPLGLRYEVVGALMAGAKGIVYRTQFPLVDPISNQSPEDLAMQAAMRWTNHELQVMNPWIHFGQQIAPAVCSRVDFDCSHWRLRDSELVIARCNADGAQYSLPATRSTPLQLTIHSMLSPHQILRITEGRMEVMRVERSSANESWQVDQPNPIELFVITGDPRVINFVRQRLTDRLHETASDQLEIANYNLQQASELIEARFRLGSASMAVPDQAVQGIYQQGLTSSQQVLEHGFRALQAQQASIASSYALQSIDRIQGLLRESYEVAIQNLASPQSSSLVLHPGLLKYHWLVANSCQRSTWQNLELPGSQLSDLQQMLGSGWSQQRRLEDEVEFRVELLPQSSEAASRLRLAAYPRSAAAQGLGGLPGGYEGASLRVRSSPVNVQRGQLVRLSAVAHVRQVGNSPASGLLVYDNQAWTSMGQLVRGSPGDRVTIELYRFVNQDGPFQMLVECRGICDVQLESITASVIEPASNIQRYETQPLSPQLPTSAPTP